MADLIVLTEDAAEVTGGEKDRTRSPGAGNRRLFTEVESVVGYHGFRSRAAETAFACQPVDAARLWAEPAGGEKGRRAVHGQYYIGSATRMKAACPGGPDDVFPDEITLEVIRPVRGCRI
jgi:hypothetical protein